MYFLDGLLADRGHPEQCKTSASTRAWGMNFPCHAKNSKIPAQKLKGHETAGKILPEQADPPGVEPTLAQSRPDAHCCRFLMVAPACRTIETRAQPLYRLLKMSRLRDAIYAKIDGRHILFG
jgi:hypothetical protein